MKSTYKCLFCGLENPSETAKFCSECGPTSPARDWTPEDIDQESKVAQYVSMLGEFYFDAQNPLEVEKRSLKMRERLRISHATHSEILTKLGAQKKSIAHLSNFQLEFNENVIDAFAGHDTFLDFRFTNLSEDDSLKASLVWDDLETTDRIDFRAATIKPVKPLGTVTIGGKAIFDRIGIKEISDLQLTISDQFGESANFRAEPFRFKVGNHNQKISTTITTNQHISIEGRGVVDASGVAGNLEKQSSGINNQPIWRELKFFYIPLNEKLNIQESKKDELEISDDDDDDENNITGIPDSVNVEKKEDESAISDDDFDVDEYLQNKYGELSPVKSDKKEHQNLNLTLAKETLANGSGYRNVIKSPLRDKDSKNLYAQLHTEHYYPNVHKDRKINIQSGSNAKKYKNLIAALDIGTAKVMLLIAEVLPDGQLQLVGMGVAPSNGLNRGVVVNIDAALKNIQQALKEAEHIADCKITHVYTGITGGHIVGLNSTGMIAVSNNGVINQDVLRVFETAKAIQISTDQHLLLVQPQKFVIDGQEVGEPVGMSGIRLEASVHIVTTAQSAAENIIKCVRRCGLEVAQLMLNPMASSLSVLTDDERELGVVLVDIGAGTTDVVIFTNGSICHTAVIPIAGDLITSDIAMALRTPSKDAEKIKIESGFAKQILADPEIQVEVPGLSDRNTRMLSQQALASVIEPRVEEIFSEVHKVILESGYEYLLSAGIVLTGGSSVMPGMVELAEDIFLMPVRRGIPNYNGNLANMVSKGSASTAMGLLEEARFALTQGNDTSTKNKGGFWSFIGG